MVKEGAKLIVVDYLQLMTGDNAKTGGNRDQEIGTISRGLKAIAKELSVPVIALSQLSRAVETRGGTKEPMMSDLRESGNIEQDADIVTFLYRPEYYNIKEDAKGNPLPGGITKLIFAKHRNGPLGDQTFRFFGANTRFVEYDHENPVQDEYMPAPAHSEAMERAKPGVEQDIPF
jgi:replicative DNA helicase